tara:strand:+ start:1020 stop:1301 length:282 start_codon:yes stop_codon:yes gene_type:complete
MPEKIGETEAELEASQLVECRQIVRNVINFGVTEKQKIHLIYLLSLELESRDAMNIIVDSVKKIKNLDEDIKFSLTQQENDYNNNQKPKLLEI